MKAAMILVVSMMLGLTMSSVRAADSHDHGQATAGAKTEKVQSLGGGKTCDKCKKNKAGGMGDMGGMDKCCCAGMKEKMGMMHGDHQGGMDHNAMMERMQKMEARMDMMERMGKAQGTPAN